MLNPVHVCNNWRPRMLQAGRMLGRVEECDQDMTECTEHKERVDQYLKANGLAGDGDGVEEKRVAVFLTIIGSRAYRLLRSLTAP